MCVCVCVCVRGWVGRMCTETVETERPWVIFRQELRAKNQETYLFLCIPVPLSARLNSLLPKGPSLHRGVMCSPLSNLRLPMSEALLAVHRTPAPAVGKATGRQLLPPSGLLPSPSPEIVTANSPPRPGTSPESSDIWWSLVRTTALF